LSDLGRFDTWKILESIRIFTTPPLVGNSPLLTHCAHEITKSAAAPISQVASIKMADEEQFRKEAEQEVGITA